MFLSAIGACTACGDCYRAYRVTADAEGVVTHVTSTGTTEWRVEPDADCDWGFEMLKGKRTPLLDGFRGITVSCSFPETRTSGTLFRSNQDNINSDIWLYDLSTAKTGETRLLRSGFVAATVDAVLTVTRAEGEFLPHPDGPNEDYLREFTLTANLDCDATSNENCEGQWSLRLVGRQSSKNVQWWCVNTEE